MKVKTKEAYTDKSENWPPKIEKIKKAIER